MFLPGMKITNAADLLLPQGADPAAVRLVDPGHRRQSLLTAGALDDQAARFAGWLAANDVGRGDAVLVLQPHNAEFYIALLAVMHIGAVAVFADSGRLQHNIRAACRELKPKAMIGPARMAALAWGEPAIRAVPVRVRTSGWWPGTTAFAMACRAEPIERLAVPFSDPAIISFAAGPGGYPLGAVRSHGQIMQQHAAMSAILSPPPGSVVVSDVPSAVLSNLALGVPSVLLRSGRATEIERCFSQSIPRHLQAAVAQAGGGDDRTYDVNRAVLSPATATRLAEMRNPPVAALRDLIVTGPVYPDVQQRLDELCGQGSLRLVYGHPEVDPIAELSCGDVSSADRLATSVGRGVLVGLPVPEVSIAILPDEYGLPIGPFSAQEFEALKLESGEIGEIAVCAEHMVGGYVNGRSEADTRFHVDDQLWLRTGDAGMLDSQGRLWALGRCMARMDDELGTTYPLAVEAAARCQLGLRRLACVDHDGRSLLVIESAASLDIEALHEVIGMTGISGVVVVDKLPMDRHSDAKVDYQRLAQMLSTRRDLVRMDFDDENL